MRTQVSIIAIAPFWSTSMVLFRPRPGAGAGRRRWRRGSRERHSPRASRDRRCGSPHRAPRAPRAGRSPGSWRRAGCPASASSFSTMRPVSPFAPATTTLIELSLFAFPQAPGARSARLATRLAARRRSRAGRAASRPGPAHLPHLGARRPGRCAVRFPSRPHFDGRLALVAGCGLVSLSAPGGGEGRGEVGALTAYAVLLGRVPTSANQRARSGQSAGISISARFAKSIAT